MAYRIMTFVPLLFAVHGAEQSSCSYDGADDCGEVTSMLQVHRPTDETAGCVHFFVHGCHMKDEEVPNETDVMQGAFTTCCIEQGGYENQMCELLATRIFNGHEEGPPTESLCLKLAHAHQAHQEHRNRTVESGLAQRQNAAINRPRPVGFAELDMVITDKSGFGPAQPSFACSDNWEWNLERATYQPSLKYCKEKCEFDPDCTSISYSDTNECVMCGTPTMSFLPGWTTYVKQGNGGVQAASCATDEDCDFEGCRVGREENEWRTECMSHQNMAEGKCVNRHYNSEICKDSNNYDVPIGGHWCWEKHLFKLCPKL